VQHIRAVLSRLMTIGGASLLLVSAAAQVELTVAHTMTGGTHRVAFDQIVDAFHEAHPDIRINQLVQPGEVYEDTGLISLLQSNNRPDIWFQWGGDLVRRDAELGFAADLSEALAQDGWQDTFLDASWAESSGTMVNGGIYMIPYAFDVTTVIWYNTDIFEEHGLSEPETWEELVDISARLNEAGVTPMIIGNQQFWPLGNWAGHITTRVVGMDKYHQTMTLQEPFSQPAFEEAFARIAELAEVGAFNRDLTGLSSDAAMTGFFQGAAAMHPIGSWLIPNALDTAPEDFNYAAFNTPLLADSAGDPHSIIGVATGFEVNADTPHFDEAITFLRFFTAFENQLLWAEGGRFSSVAGVMEQADVDPHNVELADLFLNASEMVPPPDTGYPVEIADIFYQGAALVASGQNSPAEALEWVDAQLEHLR